LVTDWCCADQPSGVAERPYSHQPITEHPRQSTSLPESHPGVPLTFAQPAASQTPAGSPRRTYPPDGSTDSTRQRPPSPAFAPVASIADTTSSVTDVSASARTVGPAPDRQAPTAPAPTAAAIIGSRCVKISARYGWCRWSVIASCTRSPRPV